MGNEVELIVHKVNVPAAEGALHRMGGAVRETLFPDDPFRQFKKESCPRRLLLALQYIFPILEWAPKYSFHLFKSDVISGITIASLAIPQGISYAKLANLPPVIGLYSSFVPPIIYAMLGSSKDVAVGTVAVVSLLLASMISKEASPAENPDLYLRLVFTATLFAGIFQASLGVFRLGLVIDFLSHATIVGFMGGAATVVCLQQLKGILGLEHFTTQTDIVSVMLSVWKQIDKWTWESIVLGVCILLCLLLARYISKKSPKLFLIAAAAPLTSVIFGSLLVFITRAENHGVEIVGYLKKGVNPTSLDLLVLESQYLKVTLKTGIVAGIISLTEGIAVGRTFCQFKNYHIDGNKEMMAIGVMNIAGSCTSCCITTGSFSRTAINVNAGCKTAMSNLVMATAVMITLLCLTPLFYYTPLVLLSSIILSAMLGLIDVKAAYHLWKVDRIDFIVCVSAYLGVVFRDVETGLLIAVAISLGRVVMQVTRPHTASLGNIGGTTLYRNKDQYPDSATHPGILILRIDSPIYFPNSNYLRERILKWIDDEEANDVSQLNLRYLLLDISLVTGIDTSGVKMLRELKKTLDRRQLQLALVNPGLRVMEKLHKANLIEYIDPKWIFLSVGEAVSVCNSLLHACPQNSSMQPQYTVTQPHKGEKERPTVC
eukprot:Gb_07163 [translate_table: standard]